MNQLSIFYLLITVFIVAGCNNHSKQQSEKTKPLTIAIQSYKDIDPADVADVIQQLKLLHPDISVRDAVSLPVAAFNPDRGRYRADSLVNILKRQAKTNEILIGFTGMDISTTKGSIPDWGIMGLSYCPGNSCIVSTFRLSPQYRKVQLFKVAIHELGHANGLNHCPVQSCFMRDAEGSNPLNEETAFCNKCKAVLVSKGWKL